MPFWYAWPSWRTELLSGLLCVALFLPLLLVVPSLVAWWFACAGAHALSLAYERWIDLNGWSWADVRERELGILLGLLLWRVLL